MSIQVFNPLEIELVEVDRGSESDAPVYSRRVYSNEEARQFHGVWKALPGLHRNYAGQETVYILEGQAIIRGVGGSHTRVSAGDFVVMSADEVTTWEVLKTIRKVFVVNK